MHKAVVLLSGGLDSAVLLAKVVRHYGADNVTALNIYYGQKHDKEMAYAKYQAEIHNVRLINADLSSVFKYDTGCTLLKSSSEAIPCGPYSEQLAKSKTVSTYVPFRNGLFLAYAASVALQVQAEELYYGAHRDDVKSAYPDCSRDFIEAMDAAIYFGTAGKITLNAPFWDYCKADIVLEGIELRVPFEFTWSCYDGKEKPCGTCATCLDRAAAFAYNGIKDPAFT